MEHTKTLTVFASALISLYAFPVTTPNPNCPVQKLSEDFPVLPSDAERDAAKRSLLFEKVRERIPGGVQISADDAKAVSETEAAIRSGALTLYEPAFRIGGEVKRFDVLSRKDAESPWDLTYVSQGTTVNYDSKGQSLARRKLQLEAAGLKPGTLTVLHLNESYRLGGEAALLHVADLTERANKAAEGKTIADFPAADFDGGDYGKKEEIPYLSVLQVPWIPYGKRRELLERGITDFKAVLANKDKLGLDHPPTAAQLALVEHAIAGKQYLNRELMKEELQKWDLKNPLIYLDFETIDSPVPKFPQVRPNQQVPFQYSVEVGSKHFEYLHDNGADPRPGVIAGLLRDIPKVGSIVAYNKEFEAGRLNELAEAYPEHADALQQMASRLVDPWPVLKKTYFDKAMKGSYSLKSIAPAILGQSSSYKGMEVANGLMAQAGFEALAGGKLTDAQRAKLKQAMLDYCEKDTAEVASLVDWMIKTSGARP